MIAGPGLAPLSSQAAQSLPPLDPAAMPPEVRRGTPEQQRAYRAALGFERMLIGQLVKSMSNATKAMTGEDGQESASTGAYKDLFSESLADNVARGGGLGLAKELYRVIAPGAPGAGR